MFVAVRPVQQTPRTVVEELANALQTAVLLAASLEQAVAETQRPHELADLRRAVDTAARAAHELRNWAQRCT